MACSAAPFRMLHQVSAAAPADMTPPPGLEASDFERIGDLGEGGFARVSKVRHRRTGDVFALKEAFSPSTDPEEEAEVLRRASMSPSPFVVRCHAVFVGDGGGQASVLEYMDAGSLFNIFLKMKRGGFPEPAVAEVAARCLKGLDHLHRRGVAHLDVKPDNFLVNSSGEVKICDFNTSRIVVGRAGAKRRVPIHMGTVAYFSPERFSTKPAEPEVAMAADVWGLGLTILILFLGQEVIDPRAEEPTVKDWFRAICHRKPPSVPEGVEASAELRRFVTACMHKDPRLRATVPDLLEHPFVRRRDVAGSSRALREFIVKHL